MSEILTASDLYPASPPLAIRLPRSIKILPGQVVKLALPFTEIQIFQLDETSMDSGMGDDSMISTVVGMKLTDRIAAVRLSLRGITDASGSRQATLVGTSIVVKNRTNRALYIRQFSPIGMLLFTSPLGNAIYSAKHAYGPARDTHLTWYY